MNLREDVLNPALRLFGLQFKSTTERNDDQSGALSVGLNDDGSAVAVASSVSMGIYLDVDGQIKSEIQAIEKYRDISLYVEVDEAVQDITNESIPMEDDKPIVQLNLDKLKYSDNVKKKIVDEFEKVLQLLYFDKLAADIFRRWYVDGRIYFQIIVDKNKLDEGIQELIPLDSVKIKKVKEVHKKRSPLGVDVVDHIEEYFIYNENGFVAKNMTSQQGTGGTGTGTGVGIQDLRISPDAIIYCPSGYVDANTGMTLSYLHKAIRPINQLRMLEDATVIYFIARAPERRVFYIDVGNLPKLKAEQYMKDIMNRYRNKMVYDVSTGNIKDDKKYQSVLEDYWMPRRDGGKGTEIDQLPGAQNIMSYLDSLDWFKAKMYRALNVPVSRMESNDGFNLGRSSEITRDELKFQKFVDRLRMRFGELVVHTLRTQLLLKGICNQEEWDSIKNDIKLIFQSDNYFTEFKDQDILTSRINLLNLADPYLQKYFTRKWILKKIMRMSDDEIKDLDKEIKAEEGDEKAQPQWKIEQDAQMQAQEEMMGQQAGMQGAQQTATQQQVGAQSGSQSEPEYDAKNYKPKSNK